MKNNNIELFNLISINFIKSIIVKIYEGFLIDIFKNKVIQSIITI